jgi:2-amino-4-hydroxy-6-hydroxymethyldihydropteridine diphosphokinase
VKAWLGLGSNMQRPAAQLETALDRLTRVDGIEVLEVSGFYRTPPWGDEQQDDFVNAVAHIETRLEPEALLQTLQSVEREMGRRRSGRRWGPRIIDIDLLLYGDLEYRSETLELPHPRMHERAFVLVPLCELDAGLRIPARGLAGDLLQTLDCSGIHTLNDGEN